MDLTLIIWDDFDSNRGENQILSIILRMIRLQNPVFFRRGQLGDLRPVPNTNTRLVVHVE